MTSGPYGDQPAPLYPYGNEAAGRAPAPAPGYAAGAPAFQQPDYLQPGYQQAGYRQPDYQQQGYGAPGYPPPVAGFPIGYGSNPQPQNGMGTSALVLGIIGVVFCWIPWFGWPLNILAIIFGSIGRKRAIAGQATNRSAAVAGLVLGVIGLAVWLVFLVVGLLLFTATVSTLTTYGT